MHDERTGAYLRVLDPADNSTGGGSASALAGGMAAALAAMVRASRWAGTASSRRPTTSKLPGWAARCPKA